MEKRILAAAPNDIELGRPRDPLEYFVEMPTEKANANTGLFIFIPGWGMDPGSEYVTSKLMPYLANAYNCVVISLRYQGIAVKSTDLGTEVLVPNGWFENIHRTYHTPLSNDFGAVMGALANTGVREVSTDFPLQFRSGHSYLSFGFMPALDHLSVLSEILKTYDLNKKRMFVLGSSYGGYIASLLTKLAPNTFTMVIDNSGFANTQVSELNYAQSGKVHKNMFNMNGIGISMIPMPVWNTTDRNHPCFFKPEYEKIRDLGSHDHWSKSKTSLFCFHYKEDPVASYSDKLHFCELRAKTAPTKLVTVTEQDLDGRVFKNLEHGFSASMKGLIQYVLDRWQDELVDDDQTDFDRETELNFDCGELVYTFKYYKDNSYKFELMAKTNT